MYNVSINNGEKQYVKVGEAEEFFTQVKEKYTDPTTTISIELTDYTLSEEDEINESNLTIIFRPFMEMLAGNLESFSMTYDGEKWISRKKTICNNILCLLRLSVQVL